ncbi:MAG TPA: polysaccharide deacetylase family protein [Bryobacteraceae bacterium]|jgi:peptidoglycan/xylan/chitin deacetylase (PgdA/CDA1 family)|nr:polysaccharide deacetylase family protein [Bryobacteraceae bacterium]
MNSAILTYHSLDETGSVISLRPADFQSQMAALAASTVRVVPLPDVLKHPGAVAITFDDGFASFADRAVPVLQRFSFPATVFIVSGYCGGRNNWPTQPCGVPQLPLMSWSALRDLPAGISLGAHCVTHPNLRALTDRQLEDEVRQSRVEIEQRTSRAVEAFAYPYGAVDARAAAVVRPEFRVACGTRLHFASPSSDPVLLPRLDAYYLKSEWWFRDLLGGTRRMYIALRRAMREARACISG